MRRLAIVVTACLAMLAGTTTTVAAAGDGGASTRVVGRGDIVTSILGWRVGRSRPSTGAAPRCAWRTLTDAQLEWLVSVAAQAVALGLRTPLLDPLGPHLGSTELPDGDLQGYVCGVDTYELRFVPSTAERSVQQVLYRQMITRLPAPEPILSPPAAAVVPVGQPVFVSIAPERWQPIEGTLTHDGLTAQVRAVPVGLRVITGDPASTPAVCHGPGTPFRAALPASPAAQARRDRRLRRGLPERLGRIPLAAASDAGAAARPGTWLGTVTVVWSAQWRVGAGPWIDLGQIPRTRLITRSARDLTTSVETPG